MDVLAFLNDDPSDRQGLKSLLNYDRSKALLKKNKIKKVLRKIVTPKNYDDSQKSKKELVIFSQKVKEQAKLLLPVFLFEYKKVVPLRLRGRGHFANWIVQFLKCDKISSSILDLYELNEFSQVKRKVRWWQDFLKEYKVDLKKMQS